MSTQSRCTARVAHSLPYHQHCRSGALVGQASQPLHQHLVEVVRIAQNLAAKSGTVAVPRSAVHDLPKVVSTACCAVWDHSHGHSLVNTYLHTWAPGKQKVLRVSVPMRHATCVRHVTYSTSPVSRGLV